MKLAIKELGLEGWVKPREKRNKLEGTAGTRAWRNERVSGAVFTMAEATSQSSEVRQELYVLKFKLVL